MGMRGGRGVRRAAVLGASALALLAGCSSGSDAIGPAVTSTTATTVAATTTSTAFTTLTSAPNISVAPPSCRLSVQGAPIATGSVNLVLSSGLPLQMVDVSFRYGNTLRRFTMKTSGVGSASHPLPIPRQAAGLEMFVTATLPTTNTTCATDFGIPA